MKGKKGESDESTPVRSADDSREVDVIATSAFHYSYGVFARRVVLFSLRRCCDVYRFAARRLSTEVQPRSLTPRPPSLPRVSHP